MSKINECIIKDCAKKMYIKLTDEEVNSLINILKTLEIEFDSIEKNFSNINDIEPMTHTINIPDVILRNDIPVESPSIEEILRNATHVNGRQVEVPKVVG